MTGQIAQSYSELSKQRKEQRTKQQAEQFSRLNEKMQLLKLKYSDK